MNKRINFVTLFFLLCYSLFSNEVKKDVYYFIDKAFSYNSTIKQARFEIKKYSYLELEAFSVFTPKIEGITWLAPMYTITKSDDIWKTEKDYSNWGPYYHLDLQFQQPVFAFTRVLSAIKASRAGKKVAEADVEITKFNIAKDIRTYYYGVVFAKTMLKTVELADEILSKAIEEAKKSLKEGKSEVSNVDIDKLNYFYAQIPINRSFIEKSINQAQEALELTCGEKLKDEELPDMFDMEIKELKDFDYYKNLMLKNRPLLKKIDFGIIATRNLI